MTSNNSQSTSSTSQPVRISIVVPCYDESANGSYVAERLIPVAQSLATDGPVEVIFVNDGSHDDTQAVFERVCRECATELVRCRVVRHAVNRGPGAAIRTGFRAARGEIIVTTDCDATYRFDEIPGILACLTKGVDLVTASQYHPKGRVATGVPFHRLVLSRGSSTIYRLVVTRRLWTYTSLFRVYRRSVIEEIPFSSDGFLAWTEIMVNAYMRGFHVAEYPSVLHGRTRGVSKTKLLRTIASHVRFQARVLAARVGLVAAPWNERPSTSTADGGSHVSRLQQKPSGKRMEVS
jgi:dolichol-phosphate mannosyltransferase